MSELVLHRGAREASWDEVRAVEAPPPTATWHPVRHGVVLDAVSDTLASSGFSIEHSWLSLSQDSARMFAVLHLATALAEGVYLSVGVRNSQDKSFPLGLVAGSRCFVCDNLSFSSEIVVTKRHTLNGERRYREAIVDSMSQLQQFSKVEMNRISQLREHELTPAKGDSVMLRAFESGIVGARILPRLITEYRNPPYEEFKPRTAWSLLNAFTSVVKPRFKSQPHRATYEMMRFQSLLH